MSATTILGKVTPTPRGEWNAAVRYEAIDIVSYNGGSWISKRPNIGVQPVDGDDWLQLSERGSDADVTTENIAAALGYTPTSPAYVSEAVGAEAEEREEDVMTLDGRIGAIEGKEAGWNAKYDKPSSGIPKTDLASGVQSSLDKADSALQEHQSLAAYSTTAQMNTAISAHHDDTKQDVISDLASIRSGAALGATALQSVPSTYRTAAAQDTIDAGKVDKVTGKGLSINDYTNAEKSKLEGIEDGAEANVQPDWNQTDTGADDFIKNKPTIPSDLADLAQDSTHRTVTDAEKTTWNGKQNKITASGILQGDGNGGVTAKTVDSTPTAGSSNLVTSGGVEAAKENKQPHPYDYDGVDLKALFGNATALHTALAAGDYSKIHNGDYYPVTFSGSYRDYGEWVALAGTKYYSDTACTQEVGEVATDTVVTYVDASPAYHDITISGTTYHCKMQDLQRYREKTINQNALMEANINPYWQYGDSGVLSGKKPHICWIARDGIGNFKMRSTNQQWADAVEEFYTGDGSTTVFTTDDETLKCVRYVCVNGTLQTYNTAYTVDTANGKVTFKSGYVPANGAAIIISRTTHDNPWIGSAIFKTLNDADHGLMRLITDTEFAGHILDSMRFYGETRSVANSLSGAWFNRGKGFLPMEPEVWGEIVHSYRSYNFLPQLPVFANGGRRHISKGSTNAGSRYNWWLASSTSVAAFCYVTSNGYANNYYARLAVALVPGFVSA